MNAPPACVSVLDGILFTIGLAASVTPVLLGGLEWIWIGALGFYATTLVSKRAAWFLALRLGWRADDEDSSSA